MIRGTTSPCARYVTMPAAIGNWCQRAALREPATCLTTRPLSSSPSLWRYGVWIFKCTHNFRLHDYKFVKLLCSFSNAVLSNFHPTCAFIDIVWKYMISQRLSQRQCCLSLQRFSSWSTGRDDRCAWTIPGTWQALEKRKRWVEPINNYDTLYSNKKKQPFSVFLQKW